MQPVDLQQDFSAGPEIERILILTEKIFDTFQDTSLSNLCTSA